MNGVSALIVRARMTLELGLSASSDKMSFPLSRTEFATPNGELPFDGKSNAGAPTLKKHLPFPTIRLSFR